MEQMQRLTRGGGAHEFSHHGIQLLFYAFISFKNFIMTPQFNKFFITQLSQSPNIPTLIPPTV